jgi:hypothetical protein
MNARSRLFALILTAPFFAASGAGAQSVGPDEAVGPPGSLSQATVLSQPQRRAIYESVARQRVRSAAPAVAAVVGAPVPPSLVLHDLPAQPTDPDQMDDFGARVLKYAMVADDVVVVDPIAMRIVDVIHRDGVKP